MIPSLESRNASDFINNSQYVKKEDLMGGNDRGYTIQDIDVKIVFARDNLLCRVLTIWFTI